MVSCPSVPPPFYVRIKVSHPVTRLFSLNSLTWTFLFFNVLLPLLQFSLPLHGRPCAPSANRADSARQLQTLTAPRLQGLSKASVTSFSKCPIYKNLLHVCKASSQAKGSKFPWGEKTLSNSVQRLAVAVRKRWQRG